MKLLFFLLFMMPLLLPAQGPDCRLKPPAVTIHFGSGNVRDLNATPPAGYRRVTTDCPPDGYYTYTPFTVDCFQSDWLTLTEDHTPGDAAGNMLLVNAAWDGGPFLTTTVSGLKGATVYEIGLWLMNVCKPSDKCPFPLLPNIVIDLRTPDGKAVARFRTGELERRMVPVWMQYRAMFTVPASTTLTLTMIDESPGGCGNDFALDDITFRECVKPQPVVLPKLPAVVKKEPVVTKPVTRKDTPPPRRRQPAIAQTTKPPTASPVITVPVIKKRTQSLPPPPAAIRLRENPVIKRIEIEPGDIRLDLYDNGEIDGDTVSVYHNNVAVVTKAALSRRPVSLHLTVDAARPHHELVLVAENLGSIPPNTSLMIVTTATGRYEVFISASEQKNAKLVIDLRQ